MGDIVFYNQKGMAAAVPGSPIRVDSFRPYR